MNSVYRNETGKKGLGMLERMIAVLSTVALVVGLIFGFSGEPVYGAVEIRDIGVQYTGDYYVTQGKQDVNFSYEITNKFNGPIQVSAELDGGRDISITSGNGGATITIAQGKSATCAFKGEVARRATAGEHTLTLKVYDGSTGGLISEYDDTINIGEDLNPQNGAKSAAFDVTYKLSNADGIVAGEENVLSLDIFNRGNTEIKNAQISLALPEGMSINNGVSYFNAGYITVGDTYKCKFPIFADESLTSKNYGVTVKVKGTDSSNDSVSLEQTLYLPVKGSGADASSKNVEIVNISIPQQVMVGNEFALSFDVANRGTTKLNDTKVTVEMPEGLANKTKNVFVISGLAAGASQKCSLTLFGTEKAGDNQYMLIKITAEPVAADKNTSSVSQFAGTTVKKDAAGAKTPQLMISDYNYGGTYVQAGDDFLLSLTVYNTSGAQDLTNIKVTVSAEDGAFIPVKSSNSFYIDKIAAKGSATHNVTLTSKSDAEEKTVALTVDMSYEDTAGNAFTAKDVISIPIMQETRLVVDDVVAPPDLYPGMQSGMSVNFYNMGKTILNNLRVNVEGDFDAPQSNMYYVGNMEKGKSDTFDFAFVPRQSGVMAGTIVFTYEDAGGNEQRLEKPFEVTIIEEMPMEDPGMMDPGVEEKKIPWKPIAAGGVVIAAAIGGILFKRHRKKKMEQEMEINE